jgi:bifunctional ADP-heptose synthase (sugar kinase/adenylyltransferase)
MLTDERVEFILQRIPRLTIGVLGDLFLDRYLDIDAALTEPSIETNLDAYQVTRVRSLPGAAGTVINNLVALGVKRVCALSIIGDDGEGYELRQALAKLKVVDTAKVFSSPERRTPTYTKPMLCQPGREPRELNRLDIKNRTPTPEPLQDLVMEALHDVWPQVDALLVMDQVSEESCGVVTDSVRRTLAQIGEANPQKFVLADSRQWIGSYRSVSAKPNLAECMRIGAAPRTFSELMAGLRENFAREDEGCVQSLARQIGRPVFCTLGENGILLSDGISAQRIPGYRVSGPVDIVGAGDSTSAAIGCAVAAGATLEEAAAFGNLIASITIKQIGTTGTATPEQVRRRWREVRG